MDEATTEVNSIERLSKDAVILFISIANEAIIGSDKQDLYEEYSTGDALDYIIAHDIIRGNVASDSSGIFFDIFWSLGRSLEIAVSAGMGDRTHLGLFRFIGEAVKTCSFVKLLSCRQAWIKASRVAANYFFRNPSLRAPFDIFSRGETVAHSLLRLKERGYGFDINANRITIESEALSRASNELSSMIADFGGIRTIINIFNSIVKSGKIYRGLFLFGRSTSLLPRQQAPNVPWHFLYNLALKNLGNVAIVSNEQGRWNDILSFSRDIGASLDVQSYSSFEGMTGISPHLLDSAILDNVLYDELFAFPQWSNENAETLLIEWLNLAEEEGCNIPHATFKEWKVILSSILKQTQPFQISPVHVWEHINADVSYKSAQKILTALSMEMSKINQHYTTPLDTSNRNAFSSPLYKIGNERFIVPPRGIAGRAMYERLVAFMRHQNDPQLDNKLGRTFERLTKFILESANQHVDIEARRYHCDDDNSSYDVDCIVSDDKDINIIECKTKVLTNKARGGNTPATLGDLAKSFLYQTVQATRHEYMLRRYGKITFIDGSVFEAKGRNIIKIAITMLDHGSLQNKVFTKNIVIALLGVTVHSHDSKMDSEMKKVNKTIGELRKVFKNSAREAQMEFWDELWPNLGDGGLSKAAYRGG